MPFDLSTARPVYPAGDSSTGGGFDLSTAKPVNQPTTQQPAPSYLDRALATLGSAARGGIDYLNEGFWHPFAPVETAAHLATGGVGALAGGLGFLGQFAQNGGDADDAKAMQERIQHAMTYQPRTADGRAMAAAIDKQAARIPQAFDAAGGATTDLASRLGASPEVAGAAGAAVNTGGNALFQLAGLRGLGRGIGAAEDAAAVSAPKGPPTTPAELTQQSLSRGTDVGYQLPPNLDPTATTYNRIVGSVQGKMNGEQRAVVPNQGVTNALAARSIGLDPASLITKGPAGNLSAIRKAAVEQGYDPIRELDGTIPTDVQFLRANSATKQAHANEFSGNPDVEAATNMLNRSSFDPAVILDHIQTLRGKASDAFAQGRSDAGTAFRSLATELEAMLDRHLSDAEDVPPGMLTKYRASRQLIAQTHTIEGNLNPSTGNVDASGIGQALKDGTPLTGDLRTIADFANSAPGAAAVPKGRPLPSSAATNLAGAALAHATGGASLLALPAARAFAAHWLSRRNDNPALLQPAAKSFGQSAIDAIHGNATAFNKIYGPSAPGALLSTSGPADVPLQ